MSQSQQQTQATDMKVEEIRTSINLPYIEGTSKKLQRKLKSNKKDPLFILKVLCIISFVNQKIE